VFDYVPAGAADDGAQHAPVRPRGNVLYTTQNRLREKIWLEQHGFPIAPTVSVRTPAELAQGISRLGYPAVLKTAGYGYDGKGQLLLRGPSDTAAALETLAGQETILEGFVDFDRELSVVAARDVAGNIVQYGPLQNAHANHILDVTVSPAAVAPAVARQAIEIAHGIMEALDVVGVLCVELFLTRDDRLLVNELAPRPHNSGHYSVDACLTSQFEQQLRAVCGLPLGDTAQLRPAAMGNLLGDLWERGEPDWAAACAFPQVKLHLYGKGEARPGRKMGHLTALANTIAEAEQLVHAARTALVRPSVAG
jgi:5-(carboxyamino)imidazole ribonucleotide synthase